MSGWKHRDSGDRGYGRAWEVLRRRVLERDRYLCQCAQCRADGRLRVAHEVDHIIPKAKGGTDAMDNLQAIHRDCHKAKTIRDAGGRVKPRIGLDGWPVRA